VYSAAVQPILNQYCGSCHGHEKVKGGLRLHSFEALRKGGDSGPALQPGDASGSLLLRRILLPLSHDDHMPPEGKPQPTADDVALLRWWIDAGAPADKTAADLKPPPEIQRVLQSKAPAPAVAPPRDGAPARLEPLGSALPLPEQLADELGIAITALSEKDPWLQGNASVAGTNFGDTDLARLTPLALNLRWLDLAGTRITDSGLVVVAGMTNLTRLHLERTVVTDDGLAHLAGLRELEYLNLYGTAVTDAGLAHLQPLGKLRRLYLWQTGVTPEAAAAFADRLTDREQIRRWQEEIAALQARLLGARVTVALGAPASAAAKPINSKCPVSGKDIDPAKTAVYEGKLVAFCCDQCKARFEKDPKPHLARLGLAPPAPK
jgi:YHS domain-containing protein